MCGIIAYASNNKSTNSVEFNNARDTLIHRGPDGYSSDFFNNNHIALGHRRLSIIDLSDKGKQPMSNEDKSIWLTFNGEIYNFQSLKRILVQCGHVFISNSDSEVIIHGYEEWGTDIVNHLKGMFAFIIYDQPKQKLFVVRDRFGIKPIYWYHDSDRYVFSSELKAIASFSWFKRALNANALRDYFAYAYIPAPRSIWQNVYKIQPGHFLLLDTQSWKHNEYQYWKLPTSKNIYLPIDEAVNNAQEFVHKAVKEHCISDVPVGLFLSGGIDSGTICREMTQLNQSIDTFSIGFENWDRSEHKEAGLMAENFNTTHHLKLIDHIDDELISQMMEIYDEPYAYSSKIPYYLVSQFSSKKNKVALVGDGGDEVFGGYNWYYQYDEFKRRENSTSKLRSLIRRLKGPSANDVIKYYKSYLPHTISSKYNLSTFFSASILNELDEESVFWLYEKFIPDNRNTIKTLQELDFYTFLPEAALTRADRSSMAHSLEVRVPFLDHEMVEWAWHLHPSVYMVENEKKPLLQRSLKNKIPQKVFQMPKRGFGLPYHTLISKDNIERLFQSSNLKTAGWLNPDLSFDKLSSHGLYSLYILIKWSNRWL